MNANDLAKAIEGIEELEKFHAEQHDSPYDQVDEQAAKAITMLRKRLSHEIVRMP